LSFFIFLKIFNFFFFFLVPSFFLFLLRFFSHSKWNNCINFANFLKKNVYNTHLINTIHAHYVFILFLIHSCNWWDNTYPRRFSYTWLCFFFLFVCYFWFLKKNFVCGCAALFCYCLGMVWCCVYVILLRLYKCVKTKSDHNDNEKK